MEKYRVPCAVSQEMLELIANTYPNIFKKCDGSLDIDKILFEIGFKVEDDGLTKSKGYFINYNAYIRNNTQPSKAFKSKAVYVGEVRIVVDSVDIVDVCRFHRF